MKKLFTFALSASMASLAMAAEESQKILLRDLDTIKEQKEDHAALQRRDSYQNLERLRAQLGKHDGHLRKVEHRPYKDRAPFHTESRKNEDGEEEFYRHNVNMRDIQKPGDASLAHIAAEERLLTGKRREILKDITRENKGRQTLEKRSSFKMLEDIRRDRGDFEVDEFGRDRVDPEGEKFVRMNDIEKAGDSSRLLKEKLRLADKYITHLRAENEKLKDENEQLKKDNTKTSKKLRKARKKLKNAEINGYSFNNEGTYSSPSSVRTEPTRFSKDNRTGNMRLSGKRQEEVRLPLLSSTPNQREPDKSLELMQRAAERGVKLRRLDKPTPPKKNDLDHFDRLKIGDQSDKENNRPEDSENYASRAFGR